MQAMEKEAAKENDNRTVWSVIRDPNLRLPLLLVLLIPFSMQLSCINAVSFMRPSTRPAQYWQVLGHNW